MTVDGLRGLAGRVAARVPRGIRLAVLPLVQEQVELRAHWTEGYEPVVVTRQKYYLRFGIDNLIAADTKATELHADLLETGAKVIR